MEEKIKIRTLTPIWTGGVDGKIKNLRETSILGSLRWWFEAIVRGFGGYACDPTSNRKCEYTGDLKDICAACELFGTTGWARRFRLKINEDCFYEIKPAFIIKTREEDEHKGWFLGKEDSGGILGDFTVGIYETYGECKDLVSLLLHLSSLWGIGAKTQDGFGICEFTGDYSIENAISQINNVVRNGLESKRYNEGMLSNLEDFFFAKIVIKEDIEYKMKNIFWGKLHKWFKDEKSNRGRIVNIDFEEFLKFIPEDYRGQFYPTAPLFRDWLRGLFRDGNDDLRHFLFGFVAKNVHKNCGGEVIKWRCKKCGQNVDKKDIEKRPYLLMYDKKYEKIGSKIFVSHVYKLIYKLNNHWEFKIWGYIPKDLPNNENRDNVVQKLFSEIKEDKNFVNILNLDRNSVEVKWYEVSKVRSDISSVEDLIDSVLEVDKNE